MPRPTGNAKVCFPFLGKQWPLLLDHGLKLALGLELGNLAEATDEVTVNVDGGDGLVAGGLDDLGVDGVTVLDGLKVVDLDVLGHGGEESLSLNTEGAMSPGEHNSVRGAYKGCEGHFQVTDVSTAMG